MPIAISFSDAARATLLSDHVHERDGSATMRAILERVSPAATLVEALEPIRSDPARAAVLLDIDGTLAPIVRHAADAHVPEATRTLLIEIAKRYRVVGCVSGRRAATARQIVAIGTIAYVGNHGGELLRPGRPVPRSTPTLAAWTERVREFAARVYTAEHPAPARAQRGQGRDRRLPLARRARRGGGRSGRARDRASAPQDEGFAVHWGRKVLEVRPPVALDKGLGVAALLRGRAGHRGAVRRRRHHRPRRLPRPALARASRGSWRARVCVAVSSDEAPPELAQEADLTVDGTGGVRELLEALL